METLHKSNSKQEAALAQLKVNGTASSLAIDDKTPAFSLQMVSSRTGAKQRCGMSRNRNTYPQGAGNILKTALSLFQENGFAASRQHLYKN